MGNARVDTNKIIRLNDYKGVSKLFDVDKIEREEATPKIFENGTV